MFKDRTLQVKLLNDKKTPKTEETLPVPTSVDYVQIVRETTEFVAQKVIIGVAVYVAVDTLRQVIVKVTPQN